MTRELKSKEALLEACREGVEMAMKQGADEAEVCSGWGASSSISFEKNDLQIAISDDETVFGVRVIKDKRQGFASTNDFDSLSETVGDALALAKASLPDEHHSLPSPREIAPIEGIYHADAAEVDVGDVTELGARMLERVREKDGRVSIDSGAVDSSRGARAVASSKGVLASTKSTYVSCYLFGMGVEGEEVGSFVVEGDANRCYANFDQKVDACADRFVEKAIGALKPEKGISYLGEVLFTPEATSSLLIGNLLGMLSPSVIRKGKSPLGDKLGEAIASPLLNILDDATIPGTTESSEFDREGMPRSRFELITDGRFSRIPYNHYEASCAGHAEGSTGHAAGGSQSTPGVSIARVVMRPGETKLADLLNSSSKRIVVTRFSGSTNNVTGEFSGVVKAGFLVEGGQKRPVSEVLISGNLLDVYQNIEAISEETESLYGGSPYPWVLASGISVTAG